VSNIGYFSLFLTPFEHRFLRSLNCQFFVNFFKFFHIQYTIITFKLFPFTGFKNSKAIFVYREFKCLWWCLLNGNKHICIYIYIYIYIHILYTSKPVEFASNLELKLWSPTVWMQIPNNKIFQPIKIGFIQ
jgi:hypothetical protein